MFCDEVEIKIKAGNGGGGTVSFLHEKYREFGGPDGGDGGRGGNIILKADENMNTLYYFRTQKFIKADDGENGKKRKQRGKSGEDKIISVPVGTMICDKKDNLLFDLNEKDSMATIAFGGEGGFGNAHFTSSRRQAPEVRELGIGGDEKELILKLKLVADVGLVGLPNAGKSTFLSVVTKAKPKIADYPFTTIIPNLGVVEGFGIREGEGFVIADIPGLIAGASQGKGLGDEFLKHVERTKVILHLIDINSENIIDDFKVINKELKEYDGTISKKPQIVVLTKTDTLSDEKVKAKMKELKAYIKKEPKIEFYKKEAFAISSVGQKGIKKIILLAKEALSNIKEEVEKPEDYKVFTIEDVKQDIYSVTREEEEFMVKGNKIEKFALKTDFSSPHSVERLRDILEKMGIRKELIKLGAKDGDTVKIGEKELRFRE